MTILFITQKLHGQDAFTIQWVRAFIRRGYAVTVLCLEASDQLPSDFPVHSLGKERGATKVRQIIAFESFITTLSYDRVFIHMTPVWSVFGLWYWRLRGIPVYCWYTHYAMQVGVRLIGWFGTRFFCATAQSLPQYNHSPKKTVVGHGIDLSYWQKRENICADPHRLLCVHRMSRSKRFDITLNALALLPQAFTLDVYGIEAEPDYALQMRSLCNSLGLSSRVTFHGTVSYEALPALYIRHRFSINMASDTIDKTMVEAMTCGCYPVTTKGNARAIGISSAPMYDSPEAVKDFILTHLDRPPMDPEEMYRIVSDRHGLDRLICAMDAYISQGI